MPQEWNIGDVVRLKSGGPQMTVESPKGSNTGKYTCTWFLDGQVLQHLFLPEALERAPSRE